jgi:hypothetical protein
MDSKNVMSNGKGLKVVLYYGRISSEIVHKRVKEEKIKNEFYIHTQYTIFTGSVSTSGIKSIHLLSAALYIKVFIGFMMRNSSSPYTVKYLSSTRR